MLAFDVDNENENKKMLLKIHAKKDSKLKEKKYRIFTLLLLLSVCFYYIATNIILPYQYLHSKECIEEAGELILIGGSHLKGSLTISGYKNVRTLMFYESALRNLKNLKISSRIINIF